MWFDKSTIDQYANYLSNGCSLEDVDYPFYGEGTRSHRGRCADLGLDSVHKGLPDEKGNRSIQGLKYEKLPTLLIPILNDNLEDISAEHENEAKGRKIAELEKKYADQEELMMVLEEKINKVGA